MRIVVTGRRASSGAASPLAEAEPRETEVGEHLQRVARPRGRASPRPRAAARRRQRGCARRRAPRRATARCDRVLPGGRRVAQQLEQVGGGQLLAQLRRARSPAGRACRGARSAPESSSTSTAPVQLGRPGRGRGRAWDRSRRPASRAAGRRRRSSRAASVLPEPSVPASRTAEGRAVRGASVGSKRTGRRAAGRRGADVDAGRRAELRGRDRDQRAELLDRHLLVVVGRPRRRPARGRWSTKSAVLQAARAVQRDVAEALAQRLDPALQLGSRSGAPTAREIEARSIGGCAEDCRIASYSRASSRSSSARTAGSAAPPSRLLAVGVLDVEDALAHLARARRGCRPSARAGRRRPGSRRLRPGRREARPRAGELGLLGERPGAEERLVGRPSSASTTSEGGSPGSSVASARSRSARGRARAARRRVSRPAVDDHQGVGLPVAVERRLGDAAAGGAAKQPLQLAGRGPLERRPRRLSRSKVRCSAAASASSSAPEIGRGAPTPASSSSRRRARSKERRMPGPALPCRAATTAR